MVRSSSVYHCQYKSNRTLLKIRFESVYPVRARFWTLENEGRASGQADKDEGAKATEQRPCGSQFLRVATGVGGVECSGPTPKGLNLSVEGFRVEKIWERFESASDVGICSRSFGKPCLSAGTGGRRSEASRC